MHALIVRTLCVALLVGLSSSARADKATSHEVTLCQRDVMSQITLEHQHAQIDFNSKSVAISAPTGSEVNVTGKGNFTKKDGTVKKFDYSCRVNTAEGRVVNSQVTKIGTKD